MKDQKRGTPDFELQEEIPRLLQLEKPPTETIDLEAMFRSEVSATGSFFVGGVETSSLGKLLNALPMPALLIDETYTIRFANGAAEAHVQNAGPVAGEPAVSLFPQAQQAATARILMAQVFEMRKPIVREFLVRLKGAVLSCRVHLRSMRLGAERYCMLLAEDLTLEKKQMILQKRYQDELLKAQGQLEKRVDERTAELRTINDELRREIEERKRTQRQLELSSRMIESSSDAIMLLHVDGTVAYVNRAFSVISGYTREDVVGEHISLFQWGQPYNQYHQRIWQGLIDKGEWHGEVWDRRKDGMAYPVLFSISNLEDRPKSVTHHVCVFSDISEIKQAQRKLRHLAHYDELTGLPNRWLFQDRLRQALVLAQRHGNMVALMLLDIDRFKNINDTLGHRFGDAVLVEVAKRLTKRLRMSDTVARLGGDEFLIILPQAEGGRGPAMVAHHIMEDFARPLSVEGREIFVSVSLGIAIYPNDGASGEQLLSKADSALHYAKKQGRNLYQFFSEQMNREVLNRQKFEQILRKAMEQHEFLLHYQPILDLRTGELIGLEALLRWRHPIRGPLSAARLIPIAEETALIVPIGEWVLETACQQLRAWGQMGLAPARLSINVSGRQFKEHDLAHKVMEVIAANDVSPDSLELELTESVAMEDFDLTKSMLEELRGHGLTVAIDDFGTGYSSLSYLREFPIDRIKIDRSFMGRIASDPYDQELVKAIVAVAHSRDLKVIAEGIENRQQLDFLRGARCDAGQGYLLGRPAPAQQVVKRLAQRTRVRSPGG